MGRGGRQDQALGTTPTRTQHHGHSVDASSFDGVAATLAGLYEPYTKYDDGEALAYALREDNAPRSLSKNVDVMSKNVAAMEEALFPALPREAALRASLLRQSFADKDKSLRESDGRVAGTGLWHGSICRRFLDMQDEYQQLVDLVSSHDPAVHEEQRKRERAEARAARTSEERAAFDRRQRFQETIAGISGSGS